MTDGNSNYLTALPVSSKEHQLLEQLRKLTASLIPRDLDATLSTLRRIFDNIIQHPNDDKYRQIKLTSKTFSSKVWQYPAGEELMKMSGWVVEDDHVRLRDDSCAQIMLRLLAEKLEEENPAEFVRVLNISKSTILGKRCNDVSTVCTAGPSSSSEPLMVSSYAAAPFAKAILSGNGKKLRELLSQCTCPEQYIKLNGGVLIGIAYVTRQIGMVRILVNEYGIDANILDETGCLSFLKIFEGSDSTEASQSLIIQCIKEFNIDVHKQDGYLSVLHLAVLHKLFTVVKFLVEECKVDVNCIAKPKGGTALHMAYGIGEMSIAQYLIEHGADQEVIDEDGRKPKDYQLYENNFFCVVSKYYLKQCAIIKNFGPETDYYRMCLEQGLSLVEATDATFDKFPNLQKSTVGSSGVVLETTPTLNELNCYITDMAPSYYDVGLQLGIDNRELKLIKDDHISFPGLEQKCHRMLEVWLNKNDTSATWKKLCDALERQGLNFLAGKIKA